MGWKVFARLGRGRISGLGCEGEWGGIRLDVSDRLGWRLEKGRV